MKNIAYDMTLLYILLINKNTFTMSWYKILFQDVFMMMMPYSRKERGENMI